MNNETEIHEVNNDTAEEIAFLTLDTERLLAGIEECAYEQGNRDETGQAIDRIIEITTLTPWRLQQIVAKAIPVTRNEVEILHEVMSGFLSPEYSIKYQLLVNLNDMLHAAGDSGHCSCLWDKSEISAFKSKIEHATGIQILGLGLALQLYQGFDAPLERVFTLQE